MEGQTLGDGGRYRLERQLGQGAMGQVYLALDTRLEAHVVVKLLRPELLSHERVRARFRNEALIQAGIQHPNIVRATDLIEGDGVLALVIEYVPGADLEGVLRAAGGRLPLERAASLLDGVLAAVQTAHDAGVVHRDLKPANVLVDARSGVEVPKVTDFGIAKLLAASTGRTVFGTVMGTPAYMPKEQLQGRLDVDHRADVYAAGVILYQLLTGRLPFGQGEEVPARMMAGPPAPASMLVPSVPTSVDAVLARAMTLEPEQRTGSARELRQALRHALEQPAGSGAAWAGAASTPAASAPIQVDTSHAAPPPTTFEAPPQHLPTRPQRPSWPLPALLVAAVGIAAALAVVLTLSLIETPAAPVGAEQPAAPIALEESVPRTAVSAALDPCARTSPFEGGFRFHSLVTGSDTGRGHGVHGYYEMQGNRDGCELRLEFTKTGYAKKHFSPDKLQRGTALVRLDALADLAAIDALDVRIARLDGSAPVAMRVWLRASGSRLEGVWHYTGEAARSAGFRGVLLGHPGTRDPSPFDRATAATSRCDLLCLLSSFGDPLHAPGCSAHCAGDPR